MTLFSVGHAQSTYILSIVRMSIRGTWYPIAESRDDELRGSRLLSTHARLLFTPAKL